MDKGKLKGKLKGKRDRQGTGSGLASSPTRRVQGLINIPQNVVNMLDPDG